MSEPAPEWQATLALAGMEARLTARRPENVLVMVVLPVLVLVFFTAVPIGGGDETSDRLVGLLLPGVIALAVAATGLLNLGIATAYERSYGVLKRLGGTPLTRSGLFGAKSLVIGVIVTLQVVLLAGVALAMGWRPDPGWSPILVLVGLVLGTLVFAGLGLALAGTLRAETMLAVANGLFLVFLLLGGAIVPLTRLPDPVAFVAKGLPAGALAEVLRIGFGGAGDPVSGLTVLAGWAAVVTLAATRGFRWD